MSQRDAPRPLKEADSANLSRRQFLQIGLAATAAAALALPKGSEATTAQLNPRQALPGPLGGKQWNFLVFLCDEMRFPPVYESSYAKQFREDYLNFQNTLLANGLDFQRHYVASAACTPSRVSLLTGHYPSLHGATESSGGGAKEAWDGDVFWLDPNSVPTLGQYFHEAGYRTYWRGKWHVSNVDMVVPGTHTSLESYNPDTGERDPEKEALYSAADRLAPFGFSGWIGPEAGVDAKSPLNTGSSVKLGLRGRDVSFAEQGVELIQDLDQDSNSDPWLFVCSFVNPHDISLVGAYNTLSGNFAFPVEPCVPSGNPQAEDFLFNWDQFQQTLADDLSTKPRVQASYQVGNPSFVGPIEPSHYWRYYYQLNKNVDQEMMKVMDALLLSRFKDDTIVILTSDHGDLLGSHYYMHQKFFQAYDESIRVPLIIWNKQLFPSAPQPVDTLTNHVDLVPTLLGLAGIDPEPIRQQLAKDHSEARPFVGRDLSPLILGQVDPTSINDPVYFMTDDNPTRGLHHSFPDGTTNPEVVQPSHIQTVVARLADGKLWKYSEYSDNPQFWSSPGDPGDEDVMDVIVEQKKATPDAPDYGEPDVGPHPTRTDITVKSTPVPPEFEMYNVTDDPMELDNKYNKARYASQQAALEMLLREQCAQKRLIPCSGDVDGQPTCGQAACQE